MTEFKWTRCAGGSSNGGCGTRICFRAPPQLSDLDTPTDGPKNRFTGEQHETFVSCSPRIHIQFQALVLGQNGCDWTGALVAVIAEVHRDTNQLLRYFRMPEGQADADN